jgi:hypothetical protein
MKTEGRYIMGGEDSGFPSVTESNQIKHPLGVIQLLNARDEEGTVISYSTG